MYVTPSHQFPLGAVLSHARRLSLLRWARANDAAIVEDDYDSHLRYASRPLEPLQRLDTDGRVVYLATMSRLSPSLRLGFVVAPRGIVPAPAVRYAIDWCPPWPNQTAAARFIADGHLDRHIARTTRRYRARRDRIVRRLADAPIPVRPLRAVAGLHIAVQSTPTTVPTTLRWPTPRRQRISWSARCAAATRSAIRRADYCSALAPYPRSSRRGDGRHRPHVVRLGDWRRTPMR